MLRMITSLKIEFSLNLSIIIDISFLNDLQ